MHALLLAAALLVQSPDSVLHRYVRQIVPDTGIPEQLAQWWIDRDSIWQLHRHEMQDTNAPDTVPTLYACLRGKYDTTLTRVHKVTLAFKDPANECSGKDVVGAFIIGNPSFDAGDPEQRRMYYQIIEDALFARPDWVFIGRIFGVAFDKDGTWPKAIWVVWTVPDVWVHVPPTVKRAQS